MRTKTTQIQNQIIEKKEKINEIEKSINIGEDRIIELESLINEKKDYIHKQMIIQQRSQNKNIFLEMMEGSNSLVELVRNFRVFQRFSNQSKERIDELSTLVNEQQVILKELQFNRAEIEKEREALQKQEETLVKAMEELIFIEQQLQKEIVALQSLKMEANEIKQIMEEQRKSIIQSTNETFIIPLQSGYVTCEFGCYVDKNGVPHNGIDLGNYGNTSTPVLAAASGTVVRSGWHSAYGNHVMITHNINNKIYTTVYAHMHSQPLVSVGQTIKQGQKLGTMGSSGNSTGPHLHFEIYKGYYNWPHSENPRDYISFPKYW